MRYSLLLSFILLSCQPAGNTATVAGIDQLMYNLPSDFSQVAVVAPDTPIATRIVAFAQTLLGTPYHFASADPAVGFDCSGFITYVFNHFHITVPRSSVDFTNVGTEIPLQQCIPGDLILFTGTDAQDRKVGHMGIIIINSDGNISFIHSTSGKENSVTITPLNDYYMSRFVKVVRILQP